MPSTLRTDARPPVAVGAAPTLGTAALRPTVARRGLVRPRLGPESPGFELDDPAEILPAEGGLIPVRLPLEYLSARVDATELILEADVEAPA